MRSMNNDFSMKVMGCLCRKVGVLNKDWSIIGKEGH